MGLDTSHDCWHGAYSAFMRWRRRLAQVAGIPLPFMDGFYCNSFGEPGRPAWAQYAYQHDPDSVFRDAMDADLRFFPIAWESLRPDPLHVLLNHSDCEGEIAAEDCAPLADRLEELLPLLDGDGGGHIGGYREKTQAFINGLRRAAERGEAVDFH